MRIGICSFALRGIPFLSAFYSKDKTIEESFEQGLGPIFLLFLMISIALTIIYRIRLIKCIVGERYTTNFRNIENRSSIMWSIRVLTLGAIFRGRFIS